MAIHKTNAGKTPRRGRLPVDESKTGAQYEVLSTSLLNGRIVNKGEVVTYDGVPGRFLRPLNAAAEKAKAAAGKIRKEQRAAVVQPLAVDPSREARLKLRELDNQRRGIDPDAIADPADEEEPKLSRAEQKKLEKQAEQTREQELEQSQQAGGVTLQMTGKSPETVVPTTGPGAHATQEQAKTAAEKKADAKK